MQPFAHGTREIVFTETIDWLSDTWWSEVVTWSGPPWGWVLLSLLQNVCLAARVAFREVPETEALLLGLEQELEELQARGGAANFTYQDMVRRLDEAQRHWLAARGTDGPEGRAALPEALTNVARRSPDCPQRTCVVSPHRPFSFCCLRCLLDVL